MNGHAIDIDHAGSWALEVVRAAGPWPFLRVGIAGGRGLLMPALARTTYLLHADRAPLRIAFDGAEVRSVAVRSAGIGDLIRSFERGRVRQRMTLDLADGATLRPLLRGSGRGGRDLVKTMRLLTGWGFGLKSRNLQQTPGLFSAIEASSAAWAGEKSPGKARFVVALHLYYPDLWPEFHAALGRLRRPFHLIVTTSDASGDLRRQVLAAFPEAEVHVFVNRGRDIGPFVQLLHDGRFDRFDFVCKIHGKRTAVSGHRAVLGQVWRRASIHDLIGSDQQVGHILAQFDAAPDVGMVASPRFRLPADFMPPAASWSGNQAATLALASRLGIAADDFVLDYFAGTMFWVRPAVLRPLRDLGLTLADFPDEDDARDGHLHHALERVFGALPRLVGMTAANAAVEYIAAPSIDVSLGS